MSLLASHADTVKMDNSTKRINIADITRVSIYVFPSDALHVADLSFHCLKQYSDYLKKFSGMANADWSLLMFVCGIIISTSQSRIFHSYEGVTPLPVKGCKFGPIPIIVSPPILTWAIHL